MLESVRYLISTSSSLAWYCFCLKSNKFININIAPIERSGEAFRSMSRLWEGKSFAIISFVSSNPSDSSRNQSLILQKAFAMIKSIFQSKFTINFQFNCSSIQSAGINLTRPNLHISIWAERYLNCAALESGTWNIFHHFNSFVH